MVKGSRIWILLILMAAAGLRLVALDEAPPGLEHDEVANWSIDRDILDGEHGLYFTRAYGHEAGYHYLQAASVALLGDHGLSLRLPSVWAGLVAIAASYALARRLFGERAALVNAALLALLFWPLFFSRLGVRAMLLPAVSGLAAWCFFRSGIVEAGERLSWGHLTAGGLLAGASLYTYMAARAVPLIFGCYVLYLALFQRAAFRRHWRGLLWFLLIMVVAAAPLGVWLLRHPGAEYRISEIDQPLNAALAGDLGPVLSNGVKLLGFFGWAGDPLIRQNLPGRPVLDPLGALLFYLGLLWALWRWRRPQAAFVLIWLLLSLTPSLVTADAPSSIRCINALVVVGIVPGLTLERLADRLKGRPLLTGLTLVWLLGAGAWTVRDYFLVWAQEPEVGFVWQTALRDAAGALAAESPGASVVVGGWTPGSMDPPTMALYLKRDDLALRFLDPREALLFPVRPAAMVWPAALPLDGVLEAELQRLGGSIRAGDSFMWGSLPAARELEGQVWGQPVTFEGRVSYLGCRRIPEDGAGLTLLSTWRAEGPVEEPLAIFVHLLDAEGQIIGQDDGLGAPAAHWLEGDLLLQLQRIEAPAGNYRVHTGLYNPETGSRWRYAAAEGLADSLDIGEVRVP